MARRDGVYTSPSVGPIDFNQVSIDGQLFNLFYSSLIASHYLTI